MRLAPSAPALTLLASSIQLAAAGTAYFYSYNPHNAALRSEAVKSLSPSTARVVLAQRIGVEDFHTPQGLSRDEISAINTYGASTSLFSSADQTRRAVILAPLTEATLKNEKLRSRSLLQVQDAPSFAATERLFEDLIEQTDVRRSGPPSQRSANFLYSSTKFLDYDTAPFVHAFKSAEAAMVSAATLAEDDFLVTVVFVEEGDHTGDWGSYEMPKGQSLLKRLASYRDQVEEPLAALFSSVQSSGVHLTASNGSNSTNSTNNKPLHGILPACFTTKNTCESTTRGCTGHGSCTLKYTNADAKSHKECWACACNATKSNGLTTYWTGPACQKKDISVEFWLITLFTVGLVSLVGFAVGTIWSMGEEDLPSVIGAGVSGPTARK